jgi:hypothetical protein
LEQHRESESQLGKFLLLPALVNCPYLYQQRTVRFLILHVGAPKSKGDLKTPVAS